MMRRKRTARAARASGSTTTLRGVDNEETQSPNQEDVSGMRRYLLTPEILRSPSCGDTSVSVYSSAVVPSFLRNNAKPLVPIRFPPRVRPASKPPTVSLRPSLRNLETSSTALLVDTVSTNPSTSTIVEETANCALAKSYHFWGPPRGDFRQEFAAFGFPKTSPVVTRSQAREAASRSAGENLDSSSRTHSTPSLTIPGDFDRDEEDEIDQELQDDFDEEPIPSTAEERTSSPEVLGLTTSDYDTLTPELFERSGSSPEPEDPIPSTSNLILPTPSSFRAHAQPPIASSSRLSVIPSSDLAPPPPLAPSNAASNSNPAPPAPTIPSTTTTSSSSPAPINTTNMSQNTNTPLMPPRGHSTAPSFDPSEVRSLRRYFQDLEALFTRCQITDEAAKKQWAVRYPLIDVADLWETIESFIDVAKSYNDWKADVRALYPGADDTRKWSLADMDQLIGERAHIGIHNAADLGCYYRDFMAITKHLIAQHRLSTIEQSRAFLRGFQPALLTRLETRLHLKHPDHYADDPYTMAEIHAAATFILHAYKTIVLVIQPKLAEEIFQRSMKSQFVTLTPEELLSIAPDVRNKYRDAVTPKRVSTEPVTSAHIVEISADEVTAVNQLSCSGATLEPGATIVPDPYETYLKHIPHGEHPAEFTVARDSNAIRSIITLVDNKEQIECIVDPGSQIVAMSEEVCLGLNLLFDPTIQLNMQSANGEVDRSLGLIRNVPFRIAYDILLGRPFDVLTQSVVKNFADENQTITILCPNTGETVTIPTILSGVANRIF
ncbi:predicted protein [Postia placenta Mad-698-R]|nr:predicted protein [Postia placenta Mad-698-R]